MRLLVTSSRLIAMIGCALLLGVTGLTALAAEDVYNERTIGLGRQLSCPVCEGQTVADSNSRVALEMMQAIDAQVAAGRTDEEIFTYFRARYGDEILVEPPRDGINLALWWAPVAALLLGLGVVGLYLKDSSALGRHRPRPSEPPMDPELEILADSVLGEAGTNRAAGRGNAQVESP